MNQRLFEYIFNLSGHYEWLDRVGLFLADRFEYALILILFLIAYRNKKDFLNLFIIPLAAGVIARFALVSLIRFLLYIPRPFVSLAEITPLLAHEDVGSFPSGHASFFFALAAALYLKNKKAGLIFGVFALFIGVARIFVGVHWPFDILGGGILGILVGLGTVKFSDRIRPRRSNSLVN